MILVARSPHALDNIIVGDDCERSRAIAFSIDPEDRMGDVIHLYVRCRCICVRKYNCDISNMRK
jgi:hypothetical protein